MIEARRKAEMTEISDEDSDGVRWPERRMHKSSRLVW
jgi:hypothetical protein